MKIQDLHDQLNPSQSPATRRSNTAMVAELGTPEHYFLAPGCYRTAPATTDGDYDVDGDYRNW